MMIYTEKKEAADIYRRSTKQKPAVDCFQIQSSGVGKFVIWRQRTEII